MRYLSELIEKKEQITMEKESFFIENSTNLPGKKRLNLLALGDVGSTLLMGLRLMGGDILASIGICDISNKVEKRFEMEINQIMMPFAPDAFPKVHIAEDLFDCDVFVFCASKGVPPVAQTDGDVRMVQFAANKELISLYAKKALAANFTGKFYVVSDPVDPLCQAAVNAGLSPQQVRGYGLGVMNARAAYFSEEKSLFKTEGRVFGPHGEDLVVANSLKNYDQEESMRLTELTIRSNLKTRELGFKPYIAPAMSSGAISILENLRGNWHYSSLSFGSAFLGVKNRIDKGRDQVENLPLPNNLFSRIETAYEHLKKIV